MKIVISITIISLFYLPLFGQSICKKATVYFDFSEHILTTTAKQVLDSLLSDSNGELLIELSGHTDSIDNNDFNLELSESRIKSVQEYIDSLYPGSVTYKTQAYGEEAPAVPNSSSENRALNRRVTINLIPFSNGEVVFKDALGREAYVDASYLDNCSICDLQYQFEAYLTAEEAAANDIGLFTENGETLITGGMMRFTLSGCEEVENKKIPVCMTMMSLTVDSTMALWVMNEKGLWELRPSTSITPENRSGFWLCGGLGDMCNWDYKSSIVTIEINKYFPYYKYRSGITINKFLEFEPGRDTLPRLRSYTDRDSLFVLTQTTDDQHYYISMPAHEILELPFEYRSPEVLVFILDSSRLKHLHCTTQVVVKTRVGFPVKELSLYNFDFDHHQYVPKKRKHKFKGPHLSIATSIGLWSDDNTATMVNLKNVKVKYKLRKDKVKIKVKKKHL